jgi:quercetin dioxygenase-like cupin family protein
MKRLISVAVLGLALAVGSAVGAQSSHVMQNTVDAKWGPAPPMLPAGAEIAVISGDPSKPGPFVLRLKFPANYSIPAHSHPTDENVTVLSGALFVGMGDKLSRATGDAVNPGGFVLLPQGMNHYAYTKATSTILLFGQGPFDFKYVDPKDDPRHK